MNDSGLHSWLLQYRAQWWRYRVLRMSLRSLPLLAFLLTSCILLESLFHFSTTVRYALTGILFAGFVGWLFHFGWHIRQKHRNQLPLDPELAKEFSRHPQGNGRLLNAIELTDDPSPLAQLAIELTTHELKTIEPSALFPFERTTRTMRRNLAIAGLVLTLPLLFASGRDAFARLLQPGRSFLPPQPFALIWANGNIDSYARGEPIELTLRIEPVTASTLPENGEAIVEAISEQKSKRIPFHFENRVAKLRIDDASGTISILPKVGMVNGEKLLLKPFQRIRIENSMLTIVPPGYSGLPPRESSLGDLAVLAGSRIEWSGKATADIGTLYILFRHTTGIDTLGVKSSGKEVSAVIPVKQAGSVQFVLTDSEGRTGTAPASFQIDILPDESPRVRLLAPEKDDALPGSFQLPVIARADDDFGIGRMYLNFRLSKNQQTTNWDSIKIQWQTIPPASAGAAVQWDLSRYDLLPDDGVEFFISAYDENTVTGPGRGVSEIRRMKVPSLEQWLTETETAHEAIGSELEALSKNGERVAQSLEQLAERIKRKGQLSHEDKEQARAAAEKQKELIERAENTAKELRELSKKMEESGAAARETMDKLSRLQELMQELATPELKEALQQLQEALKKMNPEQIRSAMERVQVDQKEWQEKLDRTLSLLEQIRLERRLDLLEQWSKKVAEQSRRNEMSLDSLQSKPAVSDSLSREQNKLANDSKALEEQVAQTADDVAKNPQLSEADAQEFRDAEKPEQAASQPLRQSAQSLQQKQMSSGQQQAKKGAQRAEQLAKTISEMNKKLRTNTKQDLANKMMRRIGELLELSKQQQALSDKLSGLDARTPQARTMAEQQEALRRGLSQTIDSIGALGRETFFLPRGLTAELKSAESGMEQATQAITERSGNAQSGQQSARTAMTSGAAKMMGAMGDMMNSSSSTGYEEMMQALAEMARKQAELNDKTDGMAGEQGTPMPMPGGSEPDPSMPGGQMPGGQQGLQQLAAEQGALSKMMQQLEQQAQRMKELTGRLDGIGDQMSEAEKELRDRTVTERTQRLQQQILTRLLDAQRSLQRQDYTQKRESKTGFESGGRVTTTFDPNTLENQLRQRLFELSRMGVDPVWQKRIREYWQTMTVVPDSSR